MAVLDPVKLVITNWPEEKTESSEIPENPAEAARPITLTREMWIEREDFMEDPPKKFFRLGPDRCVRLRGGYIVRCIGYDKADDGSITEIRAEYLPGTMGADAPEGVVCKAVIHWVSVALGHDAEVRLYDRLFTVENPDEAEGGFLSVINPDSLKVIPAKVESALASVEPGFRCQFERTGYFVADAKDHVPGERIVFNRTVALRDSWAKQK
jgi:glutaminyl-tRNA synthetase